jgi:hypothetical protein
MDHESYSDAYLRDILGSVRTIAMVGASPHWNRPSYFAMIYTPRYITISYDQRWDARFPPRCA